MRAFQDHSKLLSGRGFFNRGDLRLRGAHGFSSGISSGFASFNSGFTGVLRSFASGFNSLTSSFSSVVSSNSSRVSSSSSGFRSLLGSVVNSSADFGLLFSGFFFAASGQGQSQNSRQHQCNVFHFLCS